MIGEARLPVLDRARAAVLSPAAAYGALALVTLLLCWWLATAIPGMVPSRVLPSPLEVVARLGTLIAEPFSGSTLTGHALASLQRWFLGVLAALCLGLPVGIFLAWLPPLRAVITPTFELLRYIPPFAWVPIAVLWFGASTTTQALIVFIAAFPACVINTQLGVGQVDPILLRAARTLGAGSATTLRTGRAPVCRREHLHRHQDRVQQRLDGAGRCRAGGRQTGPRFPDFPGADQRFRRHHSRRHDDHRRARVPDRRRPSTLAAFAAAVENERRSSIGMSWTAFEQAPTPHGHRPEATRMTAQPPAKMEIRGVCKTFHARGGSVVALERCDLSIAQGEFVTVVGPSGCGKSTLMMIAAGLDAPTSGEILVDGVPAGPAGPSRTVVFQRFALFPSETVAQNIGFGLSVAGIERSERERRVSEQLEFMGLAQFRDAYPHELSGGMQQRVAIARALVVRPDILLMDEPFGALDAQTRTVLQEEVSRLRRVMNYTVMFITHSVEEAVYLGDRVVIMSSRPGRIKRIIDIPREAEWRGLEIEEASNHASFIEFKREIWELIRAEIVRH